MKIQELIGKTIIEANFIKSVLSDDTGYMRLKFSDNTELIIQGYYDADYTGNSDNEYPTRIIFFNTKDSRLKDDLIVDINREQ